MTDAFSVKLSGARRADTITRSVQFYIWVESYCSHQTWWEMLICSLFMGFGVLLTNGKPRAEVCDPSAGPSPPPPPNVSVHCVAALLSFGGIWDIWYEALAVLYCLNQWWGSNFFLFLHLLFCKLLLWHDITAVFILLFSVLSFVFVCFFSPFLMTSIKFFYICVFVIFSICPGRWEAVIFCL